MVSLKIRNAYMKNTYERILLTLKSYATAWVLSHFYPIDSTQTINTLPTAQLLRLLPSDNL